MRLAALCLLLMASLPAQVPKSEPRLEDDPQFRTVAAKTFLQYEASLAARCTQITPDWAKAYKVFYTKPTFTPEGTLATGLWSDIVPGTACGEPRRFRALVTVHGGQLHLSRMLPGTSNTTPLLERDTRLAVIGAVRIHSPGGDASAPLDVLDTEIVGPMLPAAGQTWKEIWLVRLGGHSMRVPIQFVPDMTGGGTSFHVDPAKIQDVPAP